jgi:hypothetical protein
MSETVAVSYDPKASTASSVVEARLTVHALPSVATAADAAAAAFVRGRLVAECSLLALSGPFVRVRQVSETADAWCAVNTTREIAFSVENLLSVPLAVTVDVQQIDNT